MFGIIGGGFGIYGYLPALINTYKAKVNLEQKYHEKLKSRSELRKYFSYTNFMSSREELLSQSTGLVIAVPPFAQQEIIKSTLKYSNIRKLIIEKPIDTEPERSTKTLEIVKASNKELRIGYTFLYTEWFENLQKICKKELVDLEILWTFKANHFRTKEPIWKRIHEQGGGPLRFYGIHLLAAMKMLGYCKPSESLLQGGCKGEQEEWKGMYLGGSGCKCKVHIKTNSPNERFLIRTKNKRGINITVIDNESPFGTSRHDGELDSRVAILHKLLQSFNKESQIQNYEQINELWENTESITL